MKGPAGYCADAQFSKGTIAILKAVSESKAFSLIGGGHLSDAIEMSGINKKKFGHISLSGGALLSYVAGEKLPGLEALG
jgi:phosphoglycerate kinase